MTPPPPSNHLDPSELGDKTFWDETYSSDLTHNASTPTHIGQTWFSDSNASTLTLKYLLSLSPPLNPTDTSFLDLGTGNGEFLFLLRSEGGFTGPMLGVDYSPASVELASRIAGQKGYSAEGKAGVRFKEWDIISGNWADNREGGFDVVLDKGTFDAVSLNAETDGEGRRVCEGYRTKVLPMVKVGGRFLVTSCNWTEDELKGWFECSEQKGGGGDEDGEGRFEWQGRVQYPRFKFGGVEGQSVSGVCFKKVS
ncbi:MAG: hypothetical protein LQ352_007625 [Teloschistes flavicans]|nr:MAG: hypothetical protein LQ352_007625 [Teloschistes flavicans]